MGGKLPILITTRPRKQGKTKELKKSHLRKWDTESHEKVVLIEGLCNPRVSVGLAGTPSDMAIKSQLIVDKTSC